MTGAGGAVGGALAAELAAAGQRTRLAFHSQRGDGVTIDFARPDTLAPAVDGVESVFLLSVSGPTQADHEGNLVSAAARAGVRRIVKLSAWRAPEELTPIGRFHHAAEQRVRDSGLAWTFLRPNFYMQNFTRQLAGAIRRTDAFALPASTAAISFVDTRDIAAVAARVLVEPRHEGRAYDITGPAALTYAEVADVFSATLGRRIEFHGQTDDEARAAMLARGTPADTLLAVYRAYRDGGAEQVSTVVRDLTGRDPISFGQFVHDHRAVFSR
ncbi:NmrA family NAD(P)-binding protein [Fodinicola acaciae]|uniref:NmrA family NAD(P)-binding protein n=1 Tax=Fodinicola acaciae TaxID=2681555 RepID=UPI001FE37874|nr:NmrA family NAD(P)-binding protein [Fodinicola acaciae]